LNDLAEPVSAIRYSRRARTAELSNAGIYDA
jgi:hypothetical protein